MDLDSFLVGQTDRFTDASELELGTLTINSGRLRVRDPFVPEPSDRDGCTLLVPPGAHRVWVTLVHFASDPIAGFPAEREAYLSVAFTDAAAARLDYADVLVAPPRRSYGALTGTDSAHIALYDDAIADITAGRLGAELDATQPLPAGYANLALTGGANVVAGHTGFGDGAFPILATFTAAGDPVAIHIDFGVLARDDEDY
jgi:hypothetical protein